MMSQCHIIIVNYNAGDWLCRSIDSALKYSDAQITVIDNCSLDKSFVNAKEQFSYPQRIRWIANNSNLGFAAANNLVLDQIKQEYAILLNPDCELSIDTIEIMKSAFAQDNTLGLASCLIVDEQGVLDATCKRRFPTPWSSLVRLLKLHKIFPNHPVFKNFDYGDQVDLRHNISDADTDFHRRHDHSIHIDYVEAISGAFMMVRKKALKQIGGLDEGYFMHCEDLDWCKRFAISGWKVGLVNSTRVTHAKGVSSASRPIKVLWFLHKGMVRFFDKFYAEKHSFFYRYLIKLGIMCSFLTRVLGYQIKRCLDVFSKADNDSSNKVK